MKKILNDMYLHISAVDEFPEPHRRMVKLALNLTRLEPDVICISKCADPERSFSVRFAWCDDFNKNPEPAILKMQVTYVANTNTACFALFDGYLENTNV